MDFLDEAIVMIRSGDGGAGCISFRREKFIPRGGPDGGDGGIGGDIIIRATEGLNSLLPFRFRRQFIAQNGQPGRGKNQSGKQGKDVIIDVPVGTLIYDHHSGEMLVDLILNNQEALILQGGKGGKGNQHFATSTNRAPRMAQPGIPGQEKRLRLSLRYLADIGLIGLPNAGKSTLLSRLTAAKPRIDSYPFTTLIPNLGIMTLEKEKTLTIADIPGLIEGASEGRGLGFRFLKHVERTKLLLHLLDVTYVPVHHILEDLHQVRKELEGYSPSLAQKDYMVLINKMDLYSSSARNVEEMVVSLNEMGVESYLISASTGAGLDHVKKALSRKFFNA